MSFRVKHYAPFGKPVQKELGDIVFCSTAGCVEGSPKFSRYNLGICPLLKEQLHSFKRIVTGTDGSVQDRPNLWNLVVYSGNTLWMFQKLTQEFYIVICGRKV